jgi:hypothetical protein
LLSFKRRHEHDWFYGGSWSASTGEDLTYRQCNGCKHIRLTFIHSRTRAEAVVMLWLAFGYTVSMERGATLPRSVGAA